MHDQFSIRPMSDSDFADVLHVFQDGIESGVATFETELPTKSQFDKKYVSNCRYVAEDKHNKVQGWVSIQPTSSRFAYRGVAEISIYVATSARGNGIGNALLKQCIHSSEQQGFWTLQAGIIPMNKASVAIHKRHGFRIVGTREKIAVMQTGPYKDQWLDVVLMERRSAVV